MAKVKVLFSMATTGEKLMTYEMWCNTSSSRSELYVPLLDIAKIVAGGNVVLLYASKYGDISTVVNISGRFKLERGMEGRLGKDFLQRIEKDHFIDVKNRKGEFQYRVTAECLMDRLSIDTKASCQMISRHCRVLTVHGSADGIVPVEDGLEFAKVIPNHALHIIEGADHEYTSHQDQLASVVIGFVKAGLCLRAGNSPIASKI